MEGNLEADTLPQWLEPSSFVLLCSDGLWSALSDQQMAEIVMESGQPQRACERLVQAAVNADGSDNASAISTRIAEAE